MPSAPSNPFTESTSLPATKLAVFLGPDDGSDILFTPSGDLAAGEIVEYMIPLTIERSAGMRGLDQVTLAYDLGQTGERLVDLQTPTKWARQISIRIEEDKLKPTDWTVIFWGDLTAQDIHVGENSESATIFGRIQPHHFGDVLEGY